jgi:hypothetical protein
MRRAFSRFAMLAIAAGVLALTTSITSADGPGWETVSSDFQGPLFGLNVGHDDNLLVAEGITGAYKLDPDSGDVELIASIPGLSDVIQIGRGEYLVSTGEGERGPDDGPCPAMAVCRIKDGEVTLLADILEWELEHDFDGSGNVPGEDSISNPFDLARLSRNKTLVSDAGGNSIHVVHNRTGKIDWVATLPYQDIDTQPIKELAGCPAPGLEFICELPPVFTIDPVATTVAVGPDGAIYAGELSGFPGPQNKSRVWRIDANAREVLCGTDDDDDECTQVDAGPFTAIIDINFGDDGTAYVLELDEAGFLLSEGPTAQGGTVNACHTSNGGGDDDDDGDNGGVSWTCEEIATGLPFPLAVTSDDESVYVTLTLGPEGPVEVARLTATVNGGGDDDGGDADDHGNGNGNGGVHKAKDD